MSLASVVTAYRNLVATAIGEVDSSMPGAKLRYHGKLPDDCCSDDGVLGVWWDRVDPSVDYPLRASLKVSAAQMTGAVQVVDLGARFVRCWYVPSADDVKAGGLTSSVTLARWEADADLLERIAEHVNLTLLGLSCGTKTLGTQVACGTPRWLSTSFDIQGGCAAVEWHAIAGLAGGDTIS